MKKEEEIIQIQVVEYLKILQNQGKVARFSHIPSSTYTPNWGVKMKNKRMGVSPGLPDLMIILKKNFVYKTIFLELKSKKGRLSPYQIEWMHDLIVSGIKIFIAYSFDQAKNIIDNEIKRL